MPQPVETPVITPTTHPDPQTERDPLRVPDICPEQRRRWTSPDISP